jgi:CheY-like chemotaxis protein
LADESSASPLRGVRILLVEDEALVAMLMEDMVGDLGGTVVASASRVAAALSVVEDRSMEIDFALLDVNLGGEDVFPVAAALAERNIPFAFSTGYGSGGLPDPWRDRPALQKPFTEEQVIAVAAQARGQGERPT